MAFLLLLLSLLVGNPQQIRPFGPPDPVPYFITDADQFKNVYQLVFFANELLDRREIRYVFAKPQDFLNDWNMLQRRSNDLKNAPYVSDSFNFPNRTVVNELLVHNRAYRKHVENCIDLFPYDVGLRETLLEIEFLYQIWDCVRDARCEYYYVHIRRQALLRLRNMLDSIDPTWYDEGRLPPHVPLWRFNYIR